jgi:hypothetical protein
MRPKSLLALCFVVSSAIAHNVQAAPTWTVTATGTISEGYETTGFFGAAGRDLTGVKYTQSFTASIDPSMYVDYRSGPNYVGVNGIVATPVKVTVDGVTISLMPTGDFYSQEYVAKGLEVGGVTLDQIDSYENSAPNSTDFFKARNDLVSYRKKFVPTLDFSQSLSFVPDASFDSQAYFYIRGSNIARFNGNIDLFEVNVDTNVPEPTSIALLGLGMAGLVTARRRRK